jgi:hypothetical protein
MAIVAVLHFRVVAGASLCRYPITQRRAVAMMLGIVQHTRSVAKFRISTDPAQAYSISTTIAAVRSAVLSVFLEPLSAIVIVII